jgi:hypothetical protein
MLPYLVGVGLALAVCVFATVLGYDRDRALYPFMTLVVASYYILFAVLGGSMTALGAESVAFLLFGVASVAGFKLNLWIVAAALAGHGVFDAVHGHVIANPGVHSWWPGFCGAYDVAAGAYLAGLLGRSRIPARPH